MPAQGHGHPAGGVVPEAAVSPGRRRQTRSRRRLAGPLSGRGSRALPASPCQPGIDDRLFVLFELGRHPDDAREEEERETGGQEEVAERRHVLDDRQRDRDDVAEDQRLQEEVGGLARNDDMEGTGDVGAVSPAASRLVAQIGM